MHKSHQKQSLMKPASPLGQGLAATNAEYNLGEKTSFLPKDSPRCREGHFACLAWFQHSLEPSHRQGCMLGTYRPPDLCAHPGPSPTWIWVLRFFNKRTCVQRAT